MEDIVPSFCPQSQPTYQEPLILKQGIFTCTQDLVNLNIIDFHRSGCWDGTKSAREAIASWLINRAAYTVIRYDLTQAPKRDDWPEWTHTGYSHSHIGRLFWNDFHWKNLGELNFGDSPDFSGTMILPNTKKPVQFWGDIGEVSATAFSISQKNMRPHDLWISVCDSHSQVVIEALRDINGAYCRQLDKMMQRAFLSLQKEQKTPEHALVSLWD